MIEEPAQRPASQRSRGRNLRFPTKALEQSAQGWAVGLPPFISLRQIVEPPTIIAIGGGKGGVGKSMISANLAARLAIAGYRVAAVDLDVGGANLHTYFGVERPTITVADLVGPHHVSFRDVLLPTPIPGVQLVAGGQQDLWTRRGGVRRKFLATLGMALLSSKEESGIDFIVLDLGAGTQTHTMDFFCLAHLGLLTVLPEPTSIENAYQFLKQGMITLIHNVGSNLREREAAVALRSHLLASTLDREQRQGAVRYAGYADRLHQLASQDAGMARAFAQCLRSRVVGLSLNQVRTQKDIDIGRSMELIGERYFGFLTRYCGYLNNDDAAWKSLRNRRLLVADFPQSALARRFAELARVCLSILGY